MEIPPETEPFTQLADNVVAMLRYPSSRFEQAVVPKDLDDSAKPAIAQAARKARWR